MTSYIFCCCFSWILIDKKDESLWSGTYLWQLTKWMLGHVFWFCWCRCVGYWLANALINALGSPVVSPTIYSTSVCLTRSIPIARKRRRRTTKYYNFWQKIKINSKWNEPIKISTERFMAIELPTTNGKKIKKKYDVKTKNRFWDHLNWMECI